MSVKTYTILFRRAAHAPPERFEFIAEDPTNAFSIARRESGDRPVELWEGDRCLGKLTPLGGELWQID